MAQYHFAASAVSFGKGQSAVAKAAYNGRTQLYNARDGRQTNDYSRAGEAVFTGIFAPKDAPAWTQDRQALWNRAEAAEKRIDGQPARNLEFSLPHELTDEQRLWLVKDFVREAFVRQGMIADVAIHRPHPESDERNHHVHVLLTMRELDGDGFAAKKNRDWNKAERLEGWREKLAVMGAKALERNGFVIEAERFRHGHETLENQRAAALGRGDLAFAESLNRQPTKHLGPTATAIERRGGVSEIGEANRARMRAAANDNAPLIAAEKELAAVTAQIIDLQAERARRYEALQEAAQRGEAERGFATGAARATDPVAPTFDRDAANAEWAEKVAAAGIAKDEAAAQQRRTRSERGAKVEKDAAAARGPYAPLQTPEPAPEVKAERRLDATAAEIRLACAITRGPDELREELAARNITLAVVSAEQAAASHRRAELAKAAGRFAPEYRADEIVAVDHKGQVYRLNERTTGHNQAEIDGRLAGLDRSCLHDLDTARAARREAGDAARRQAWIDEKKAEREKSRDLNSAERKILQCAEQARVSGASVARDDEGRIVSESARAADRLKDERQYEAATVFGAEAFKARLDEAGIQIARVSQKDLEPLEKLRAQEEIQRGQAQGVRAYCGPHIDKLELGELAAVTRFGSVYRINAEKLGGALAELIKGPLRSVMEARTGFEMQRIERDQAFAQKHQTMDAQRAAIDAKRARPIQGGAEKAGRDVIGIGQVTKAASRLIESVITGLGNFFFSAPKLTRQQVKDLERAEIDPQTLRDRDAAAAAQANEAEHDERAHVQKTADQQQDLSLSQRFGTPPTREANLGRDRDDDSGRERER